MKLIDKDALVAEIRSRLHPVVVPHGTNYDDWDRGADSERLKILSFIDTLEAKDPYEQCILYSSVKDGIEAHAETYSFNIESELFNQLTKEQQALWRKEIEQACISGGGAGYELAKDPRYKENLEVKEVDLEKEIQNHIKECLDVKFPTTDIELIKKDVTYTARKFFELGLKTKEK